MWGHNLGSSIETLKMKFCGSSSSYTRPELNLRRKRLHNAVGLIGATCLGPLESIFFFPLWLGSSDAHWIHACKPSNWNELNSVPMSGKLPPVIGDGPTALTVQKQ